MATEMLFTDPDGDGTGDWSTDAGAPIGDLATRSFVVGAITDLLSSPEFTGVPKVPTAAPGTSTTQAASTAFVTQAVTTATSMTLAQVPAGYSHTVNEAASTYTRGTSRTDIVVRFRGFTDPKVTSNLWFPGDEWLRPE